MEKANYSKKEIRQINRLKLATSAIQGTGRFDVINSLVDFIETGDKKGIDKIDPAIYMQGQKNEAQADVDKLKEEIEALKEYQTDLESYRDRLRNKAKEIEEEICCQKEKLLSVIGDVDTKDDYFQSNTYLKYTSGKKVFIEIDSSYYRIESVSIIDSRLILHPEKNALRSLEYKDITGINKEPREKSNLKAITEDIARLRNELNKHIDSLYNGIAIYK